MTKLINRLGAEKRILGHIVYAMEWSRQDLTNAYVSQL